MSVNHQARWQKPTATAAAVSWRGRLNRGVAWGCVAVACGLLALNKQPMAWPQQARMALGGALASVADTIASPLDALGQLLDDWSGTLHARAENTQLKLQVQQLHQLQASEAQLRAENKALRAALPLVSQPQSFYIAARVIAFGGDAQSQAVWINAGRSDGVREDYMVMTPEGVAGRVLEVGASQSRVLLLTDAQSRLPVMLGQSRYHAIVGGNGDGLLQLRYLPHHAQPVAGEMLLTSGDGNVVPAGLPVAVLEKASDGSWRGRPLADMARLDYVTVVDFNYSR